MVSTRRQFLKAITAAVAAVALPVPAAQPVVPSFSDFVLSDAERHYLTLVRLHRARMIQVVCADVEDRMWSEPDMRRRISAIRQGLTLTA
jgi:hypothetical protein